MNKTHYYLGKCLTTNHIDGKLLKWQVAESSNDMSSKIYLFRTKKEAQKFIKEKKEIEGE